jgi:hypothetical protein
MSPGAPCYLLTICLASGSTLIPPLNNSWQAGNFTGAVGMDNFASKAVGTTFDIAFVMHQRGVVCTRFVDVPFERNLSDCQRYFAKSYSFATIPGTATILGATSFYVPASSQPITPIHFPRSMINSGTVKAFSPATGAVGNVRDVTNAADRPVTATIGVGDSGFTGFNIAAPIATTINYQFHWTVDSGF